MKIIYNGQDVKELTNDLKRSGYPVNATHEVITIGDKQYNMLKYLRDNKIRLADLTRQTGITRNTIISALSYSDSTKVSKLVRLLEFIGFKIEFTPHTIREGYEKDKDLVGLALKSMLSEGTISRIILDYGGCRLGTLRQLIDVMGINMNIIKR